MPGEPDPNTSALAGVTAMTIVGSAALAASLQAMLADEGTAIAVTAIAEAPAADATSAEAERTRIMGLVDLCPETTISASLKTAIDGGQSAGDFAIGLAQSAKGRGATVDGLRAGAVQQDQLPTGTTSNAATGVKAPTGQARGAAIVAKAAAMGHRAVAHLAPKG